MINTLLDSESLMEGQIRGHHYACRPLLVEDEKQIANIGEIG
jgi:hypothetical protein